MLVPLLLSLTALANEPIDVDAAIADIAASRAAIEVVLADVRLTASRPEPVWCVQDKLTEVEAMQDLAMVSLTESVHPIGEEPVADLGDMRLARDHAMALVDQARDCAEGEVVEAWTGSEIDQLLAQEPMLMPIETLGGGNNNERTPLALQAWRFGGNIGLELQPTIIAGTRLTLGDLGFTELHFSWKAGTTGLSSRTFSNYSAWVGPVNLWFGADLSGIGDRMRTEAVVRGTMWLFWFDVTGGMELPWTDKAVALPTTSTHLEYELVWLPPDMTLDITADARITAGEPVDVRAGLMLDIWWRGNGRPW